VDTGPDNPGENNPVLVLDAIDTGIPLNGYLGDPTEALKIAGERSNVSTILTAVQAVGHLATIIIDRTPNHPTGLTVMPNMHASPAIQVSGDHAQKLRQSGGIIRAAALPCPTPVLPSLDSSCGAAGPRLKYWSWRLFDPRPDALLYSPYPPAARRNIMFISDPPQASAADPAS
jgi:hypothetical protein